MKGLLVLKHIQVEGANAIAGFTWGFPAIANFLGFTHALQRQFERTSDKPSLSLLGCGIICHDHQVQAYKSHEYGDNVFALTRNPVDKTGKSSSFVEEGRMRMDISLVIPYDGRIRGNDVDEVISELKSLAFRQRLAGGTIVDIKKAEIWALSGTEDENSHKVRRVMRSLLPGFALVSAKDCLAEHQQKRKGQPGPLSEYGCTDTDLQAWLEFSALTARSTKVEEQVEWGLDPRPNSGWLRPITVGYKAISPLYQPGEVANTRDNETPVQFVENLYSLGEWLSPHRIKHIDQLYWYYKHDESLGHYLCANNYQAAQAVKIIND